MHQAGTRVVAELTGEEPDLRLGDSGEGVLLLQVRLYQLSYYRQMPDSTFDMTTENAVRELQSQLGQDNDGMVTRQTWEGIVYLEQQYSIQYQFTSPYDALTQLQYDLDHPGGASGDFPAGDPSLSEDGQWRWNGNDWQPAGSDSSVGQLSPDGQWQWDGTDWQPASGGSGRDVTAAADQSGGQLSPDGQWRWDGSDWQPAGDSSVGQLSSDGQWRWNGTEWRAA